MTWEHVFFVWYFPPLHALLVWRLSCTLLMLQFQDVSRPARCDTTGTTYYTHIHIYTHIQRMFLEAMLGFSTNPRLSRASPTLIRRPLTGIRRVFAHQIILKFICMRTGQFDHETSSSVYVQYTCSWSQGSWWYMLLFARVPKFPFKIKDKSTEVRHSHDISSWFHCGTSDMGVFEPFVAIRGLVHTA